VRTSDEKALLAAIWFGRTDTSEAPMSDEQALLAAIWEHPHEDTPRLVYADWLQEHGQPERAEFIRVQCELARLEEDALQRAHLEQRETALWKKRAKTWKAGLPKFLQAAPFRRGFPFPRRRAATGAQFLKLTAAELAPAPLWDFRINSAEKTLDRVLTSDLMTRLGTLEIPVNQIKNPAVLATAKFQNITDLQLGANWIGEAGVTALAANPGLRHLRALGLTGSNLTNAAIGPLVAAPWFPALRTLALGNNPFAEPGLRTLLAAKISALRDLSVRGSGVGPSTKRFGNDVLAALCRSPQLTELRHLDLGINYMGPSGVEVLTSEQTKFRLRVLHLDNNSLGDRGAEILAAWPGLATVEILELSSNGIGPRGTRALGRSPHLTRIRDLWLIHNPVAEPAGAAAERELTQRFGTAVRFRW
jgi:uncharacterized protein (TIGR02996 family)